MTQLSEPLSIQLFEVDSVTSTNEILLESSLSDYPFGSALLAKEQTAGRGRADRIWQSHPGGMYLSILCLPSNLQGMALLGALAVVELCQQRFDLVASIRWPNDVYCQGKKLAGILPQARFQGNQLTRAVVGVGLNVGQELHSFDDVLRDTVTTLAQEIGSDPPQIRELAQMFLTTFAKEYRLLELEGLSKMMIRCQSRLEGLGTRQKAYLCSPTRRSPLGQIQALGDQGELIFDSGFVLKHLDRQERLVLDLD